MNKRIFQNNILWIVIVFLFVGCQSEGGPVVPKIKNAQPGKVTDFNVKNFPGGARISYQIPKSKDFRYVKAVYSTKTGGKQTSKASRYKDHLVVHGFYDTSPEKVTIYACSVGKKCVESGTVTVHPLTPPFQAVFNSMNEKAVFGGVKITYADNPDTVNLTIGLLKDSSGFILPVRNSFIKNKKGSVAIHGFPSRKIKFGFYVRDRFNNYSDTLYKTLKPLFEVKLNKLLWSNAKLPTDTWTHYKHYAFNQLWDNDATVYGNSFETGDFNRFPMWFTINLGQLAKISRFIYYPQPHWRTQWPKQFQIWGSAKPKVDPNDPFNSSWILMGTYSPTPPGSYDYKNKDTPYPANGIPLTIKDAANFPDVQYIRIKVLSSINGAEFLDFGEYTFFGQPKNRNLNKNGK